MLFFNPYFQYLLFNITILILYLCRFSSLYYPRLEFVFYYITILFFFLVITIKFKDSHLGYMNKLDSLIKVSPEADFDRATMLLFIIGFIANIYQVITCGIPLFDENKVSREGGMHYVQYLVNFLMMSAMMSYLTIRLKRKNVFIMKMVFVLSIINLSVWLNRGAFTLIFLTVIYYEYIVAKISKKIKAFYLTLFSISMLFLLAFGYVGNLRVEYVMEYIFKHSVNEHYGMSECFPSWFVWIYIYLTSPLENISRILESQTPNEYTLGLNMVYPFVAPIFKVIFSAKSTFIPPLDDIAGLNVSTYILSAIDDFQYLGPYIYMGYLVLILRVGQLSLKKGIYGLLCYISSINISLWLVFSNSFAVGPFMITYLFFLIMAWRKNIKI